MRRKEVLFWILFIALCFGGGYLHGSLPTSFFAEQLKDKESRLRIVYVDLDLENSAIKETLSKNFAIDIVYLKRSTLSEVRQTLEKSPYPDLALIPIEWALRMKKENLLQPLIVELPEFAGDFQQTDYIIPTFWNIEKDLLKRWVLVAPIGSRQFERKISFTKMLFSPRVYDSILLRIPQRAVLKRIDDGSWPYEKKPSSVRDIPFHKIKTKNEHYNYFD